MTRPSFLFAAALILAGVLAPVLAEAQVSVTSPYLDIVARYRSGDHEKAVADMAVFPIAGLRDRARKDLRDLTCQVLCGTADCRRARTESRKFSHSASVSFRGGSAATNSAGSGGFSSRGGKLAPRVGSSRNTWKPPFRNLIAPSLPRITSSIG